MTNPVEKKLILAEESATQTLRHLEAALSADLYRDEPLATSQLRRVVGLATELEHLVKTFHEEYTQLLKH